MTSLARLALLLAALASWRGGSRPVAIALAVAVAASAASTVATDPRLALALYLVVPAASAWLALRVATGSGWPAAITWAGASLLALPAGGAHLLSVAVQLGAAAFLRRPFTRAASSVVVLLAGDIALALATPTSDAWWSAQGQTVLIALVVIYIHIRA